MSKEEKAYMPNGDEVYIASEDEVGEVSSQDVRVEFSAANWSNLEGKLLTFVETLGLPQKQEEAAKSTLRTMFWDFWSSTETMRAIESRAKKVENPEKGEINI